MKNNFLLKKVHFFQIYQIQKKRKSSEFENDYAQTAISIHFHPPCLFFDRCPFYFLSIFSNCFQVHSQDSTIDLSDVVITQISNSPTEGQGDQYASVAGNTTFYIKGTGFDLDASNNYVFVGPYQANILGIYLFFHHL